MSVEDSLQYLDDTLAELDKVGLDHPVYESESDLLSEFGYASGYTELSATSDSENHPKPSGLAARRRKSRQNRNQRYQSDPILGDLESDSTNDGYLFGNGVTTKTKTKTNSGQRRQRERRRQRRQNANRNSWTDSGLSLSKTDSQRSSHGENSPIKRGRSKTSPADLDVDVLVANAVDTDGRKEVDDKATSPIQPDAGIDAPPMEVKSEKNDNNNDAIDNKDASDITIDESDKENKIETVFALSSTKTQEFIPADVTCEKASLRSLDPSIKSLDHSTNSLDHQIVIIKPTDANGVVNGTWLPKEKEILQQMYENERNSCSSAQLGDRSLSTSDARDAAASPASRFPLPPHLDYPLCMYRRDTKPTKDKKASGGIMRGFKRLKEGITNKRKSSVIGNGTRLTNAREFHTQTPLGHDAPPQEARLPPSKSVEKKKSFLKRFFKSQNNASASNSKGKSRNASGRSQNFSRDRFGSSRSFSESIGQLWSRGSRARSQSMENLKNVFRRERSGQLIKRSTSSTSLAAKLPRSLSISSLIGRRGKPFTRHGSVVSVAASCSRQQSGNSAFRRADSVRSLQGGFDIATRLLQSQNHLYQEPQFNTEYYEDSNENYMPSYAGDMNTPFRSGWRPSSRISRRDPYIYEQQQYYEDDFGPFDSCYEDEGPCSCCCDDQYTDNGYYYEENEHFNGHCHNKKDFYGSRNTLNQNFIDSQQAMPQSRRSFSRQSAQPVIASTYAPNQHLPQSYYSPRSYRAENRLVVAPLNVQVTQERRAERRQLSRASQVFDTMV